MKLKLLKLPFNHIINAPRSEAARSEDDYKYCRMDMLKEKRMKGRKKK